MKPAALALVVLSVGMFLFGVVWTVGHGGDWESDSRPTPRLLVESERDDTWIIDGDFRRERADWMADPAQWRAVEGRTIVAVTGRGVSRTEDGDLRYCTTADHLLVSGDPTSPGDALVLAEFDDASCFDFRASLARVDGVERVTIVEIREDRPIWGYVVLALFWLPLVGAWALGRERGASP